MCNPWAVMNAVGREKLQCAKAECEDAMLRMIVILYRLLIKIV